MSVRLWSYKKQISHMKEELEMMTKEDTNALLSSYGAAGKMEDIILLMNRLLQQGRQEISILQKENRTYKESITSISHDIRTPLTSAKGYLQMLKKRELSQEKELEYLTTVEKRLDHLTDMLNQLFEYARIEAGEMNFEPEVFNAGNVFAETISMFYEDFVKKGCEPKVFIAQEPCRINADRHAFVRIVENLIKNALTHGTGEYELSLNAEKEDCVIRISNRTDSVEQKDIEMIFERFYTTDQSRTRKTTGLGLAIVKKFAEEMGGNAKAYLVDSRFTIEVSLPVSGVSF